MRKRILAMLMAVILLLSAAPVYANDGGNEITVYLSVSCYGKLTESRDGETMAYVPVTLSGSDSYNLDDCFREAHNLYHPDGEAGYESGMGEWGLGIKMLWGDTSYNFGYQVNAGKEAVMGLEYEVKDGDFVDACIYKNLYPDTESYSYFDIQTKEIAPCDSVTFTLYSASGYDDSWNVIYSPCEGADILLNGEETGYVTDQNGQVEFPFEAEGAYVVSAKKEKILNEETVPAITAPVCLIKVGSEKTSIIHNIAQSYAECNLADTEGNLMWIIADMAAYEELSGESLLGEEKKKRSSQPSDRICSECRAARRFGKKHSGSACTRL